MAWERYALTGCPPGIRLDLRHEAGLQLIHGVLELPVQMDCLLNPRQGHFASDWRDHGFHIGPLRREWRRTRQCVLNGLMDFCPL
jgi:hypothetical protein